MAHPIREKVVLDFMDEQDLDELILDKECILLGTRELTVTNLLVLQALGGNTRMAILRAAGLCVARRQTKIPKELSEKLQQWVLGLHLSRDYRHHSLQKKSR
jgi:hypothetical protein